ncbi:MAG TPA: hypothetical protein VFQ93_01765 [Casimicrobiaceae bacterium]|nr:hypothetical protein [Casimicrobiaceae bacterium]
MTTETADGPTPAVRAFEGVSGRPRRLAHRNGARAGTILRDAAILFACVLGTCTAALSLRQDTNWDLQNYHFYDPWAWLTGRIFGPDIAAAQLQTFHNPLLDVPFYAMVRADLDPRVIACVLALPTAVAAFFLIKLCERLFRELPRKTGAALVVAACAIGLGGAMGRSQFATTMNEWPGAMFTMAALYGLVRSGKLEAAADLSRFALVATGFLAGAASGLKLTAGTYALALAIALLLRRAPIRANIGESLMFCAGVLAGLLATIGFWCWQLWNHYGNPLFPYANQWFRSPWWEAAPLLPRRFGPHALREALLLPFELYSPPTGFVAEVKYRDPRFPLLCVLAAVGAMVALSRRRIVRQASTIRLTNRREWTFLGVFFVAAFVIWAYVHSIARYLVPLELLAGAFIVALIGCRVPARHASSIVAVVAIVVIAMTRPADWGRVPFGERWFVLKVPPIDDHALVLLASGAPMAYVLPFLPASTVNVGIATNVTNPMLHNRLQDAIADRIARHEGPLYSLAQPPHDPALALDFYGLEKGSCSTITTNMSLLPLELCRLARRMK